MRRIVCSVPWNAPRAADALDLAVRLGDGAEIIWDDDHDAYPTFLRALELQRDDDAWHFQDDAVLTSRWHEKAAWELQTHRGAIVQGFSRRKDDLTKGSRWMRGSGFNYGVCWFLPGIYAPELLAWAKEWQRPDGVRGWVDQMVADWMSVWCLRYWLVVPSLAQHKEGPSMIDPRRARSRQSRTFVA